MIDSLPDPIEDLLVGEAPALRRVKDLIRRIAPSEIPVLIQGESGTGKELVALALHHVSRRTGPFVPVNVCATGDSMFEDAMFGHERGSFTGAHTATKGYLAEAHHGTLFLDELAGLPGEHQPKLLRAVETRRFRRLGAGADAQSEFRLVSASNQSVCQMVERNILRLDLAHRLKGAMIELPPLRARRSDIPMLARRFLATARRADGRRPTVTACGDTRLIAHTWPGNVRELRQTIESAAIISYDGIVNGGLVAELLGNNRNGHEGTHPGHAVEHARATLVAALAAAEGNADRAARSIGVSRATVYRLARSCGVMLCEFRTTPAAASIKTSGSG